MSLVKIFFTVIYFYIFLIVKCDSLNNNTDHNDNSPFFKEDATLHNLINFLDSTQMELEDALLVGKWLMKWNKNKLLLSDKILEGRKEGGKQKDLMSRILPMLAIPFLISTSLIPLMLTSMKVMLIKSMFVGKMAIILLILNAIWKINNQGGVYSHNISLHAQNKDLMMEHYGYNNGEEYGAYVNK